MAQYQKFMFDNFVISCDDDKCVAEPLDVEEPTAEPETETAEDSQIVTEDATADVADTETEVAAVEDDAEEPETKEPEIKAPSYSQDDLDAAVASAEERGYNKGFAAASSEGQKQQQAVLDEINGKLLTLLADQSDDRRQNEQNALKFALELVRKLLPNLEADVAKEEVEAFLSDNFARFKNEKALSFSFNPEMAAVVAPLLSKLAEKNDFEGKIAVHKDINLGMSDCLVEWKNGGVSRSTEQVLNNVEELLNQ